MNTSKAAVFHSANQPLTLESFPVPPLRTGEILVRNEYTTLCRSDLNTFSGKRVEKTPTILGHEVVGIIAELGPEAPARDGRGNELRVGDRLTWAIYAADPASPMALLGFPQKAPGLFKYGHEQLQPGNTLHGGLAEYCILRRHTPIIRIDLPIPLPVLALINCSMATVAGSLRLAGALRGQNILIAGSGMLGLVACAMCRCAQADKIIALDVDDDRLATATQFGADVTLNTASGPAVSKEMLAELLSGKSVTVALDYSGIPSAMETLLSGLGIGGTAIFVGATFPQRALQVNAEQLVRNLHVIKGLHNYHAGDLLAAVEFVEQHHARFPFATLVHDGFNLDQANAAFACGLQSKFHRIGLRLN